MTGQLLLVSVAGELGLAAAVFAATYSLFLMGLQTHQSRFGGTRVDWRRFASRSFWFLILGSTGASVTLIAACWAAALVTDNDARLTLLRYAVLLCGLAVCSLVVVCLLYVRSVCALQDSVSLPESTSAIGVAMLSGYTPDVTRGLSELEGKLDDAIHASVSDLEAESAIESIDRTLRRVWRETQASDFSATETAAIADSCAKVYDHTYDAALKSSRSEAWKVKAVQRAFGHFLDFMAELERYSQRHPDVEAILKRHRLSARWFTPKVKGLLRLELEVPSGWESADELLSE